MFYVVILMWTFKSRRTPLGIHAIPNTDIKSRRTLFTVKNSASYLIEENVRFDRVDDVCDDLL